MKTTTPGNGHSRDPETIALAEAIRAEVTGAHPRPTFWARLDAWVKRGSLLKTLLLLAGGAAVALIVLGMRVERTADALARKADVAAAVAAHAAQPQPKDIEQDRRLDRQEERQAAMAESLRRLLDHFEIPAPKGL
jgi:hypothetical protein